MFRYGILVLLASTIAVLVAATPNDHALPTSPAEIPNSIINEPMVSFSIAGSTLTGTVHRQLTVYNSGFVTISKFDNQVFPTQGITKDVQTASVSQEDALLLLIRLAQAGALTLPDQPGFVNDVPLSTLTLLEGKELALSRTISWWVDPSYSGIQSVLDDFIASTFPGF